MPFTMTPPDWFDAAYYGQQKVIQMNALNYEPGWLAAHGAREWNFELYEQYLDAYRMPDGSKVTPWENFLACNGSGYTKDIDPAQLNVSGNPLFDPDYYCQSLVDWANETGFAIARPFTVGVGQWTAKTMTDHVINGLGMSFWEHFKSVGLREEINPSAQFDTHAYLEARAAAMSADGREVSIEEVIEDLLESGKNPIMDFEEFGKGHNIEPKPVPSDTGSSVQPVPTPVAPVTPAPEPPANPAPVTPGNGGQDAPSQPGGNQPQNPAPQEPMPDEPTPDNPKPDDPAPDEPKPDEPTPENPTPDDPVIPGPGTDADSPYNISFTGEGNYTVDPIASNGADINVYVDTTGLVKVSTLNALGVNHQNGNISLEVPNGNLGNGNDRTILKGQNIDVDLGGDKMPADEKVMGYPLVEIWAEGTVQVMGGNDYDWISIRDIGPGTSVIDLDDGKDIMELFDMSKTCTPANFRADADLHINLGTCWDQLFIGDLAVQGGETQTIHVDLGDDYERETISLGKVTAGKLVLSMEHCSPYDEITSRSNLKPESFADGESACAALSRFGISAESAELGVWHDRVKVNSLVDKAFENAAIYANDNTYVIYGNELLELQGIGAEDYENA